MDWNWLWVVGELGATYGLFRWWKSTDTFLSNLEISPDIDIDELKSFSSLTTTIDYATLHGLVKTNDAKPHSVLKSQFLPDCTGVIHRLSMRERKLEKLRTTWTETKRLISDSIRHVPFRLATIKGNFVRIDKPLDFSSVNDQLDVTHVKFEPNTNSYVDQFVGVFLGNVSKGIETKEEMLLVDTPLTGLGRLQKRSGVWYLIPHEKYGGMLTRSSRNEILSEYRSRLSLARFLSIAFGAAAAFTAAYLIYKYYMKYQREIQRLPPPAPRTIPQNPTDTAANRLQCVICLDNEIMYSLQPCSHLGLCYTCAQQLQSRGGTHELCPICRVPIQHYQRIYLP